MNDQKLIHKDFVRVQVSRSTFFATNLDTNACETVKASASAFVRTHCLCFARVSLAAIMLLEAFTDAFMYVCICFFQS